MQKKGAKIWVLIVVLLFFGLIFGSGVSAKTVTFENSIDNATNALVLKELSKTDSETGLGGGVEKFGIAPFEQDFGSVGGGRCSSEFNFTLFNHHDDETAIGTVNLTGDDPDQFTITEGGGDFSLGPNTEKMIKVEFCPTSTGKKMAALWAHTNNLGDAYSTLSGNGIGLSPTSYNFGSVGVGQCSSEYSFTLTNVFGHDRTATGTVYLAGDDKSQFIITQGGGDFSLGPGATKTIKVKFCPTSTGPKSATLYAYGSNYYGSDESTLSGTGIQLPPSIDLSPSSHNFGDKCPGELDSTTFEIWNSGTGTLSYTLSESCSWVCVHPTSGSSTGEHDTITVDIDTTGLSEGSHICDVSISSNDGSGTFTVAMHVVQCVDQPQVTSEAATNEEETTATLNGRITNDGGEACQYQFEYDTNSGEPYAYNTGWTGSKTTGQSFNQAISSLAKGTKYYFRAQAKNSGGTVSGSELTFLTKPDEPTSFSATTVSTTQIDLSWSMGAGAQKTKIQRKTGSYPANKDDGTQVYFDTGSSKPDTGLSPGTTYYYRAWSYVQGSEQWSDNFAEDWATTTSIEIPTVTTNAASDIGTASATLNGNLDDTGGETCQVWFEYGKTTAYGSSTSPEAESSTCSFSKGISDLDDDTTYHFRAVASNSEGPDYGDDMTFKTKKETVPHTDVGVTVEVEVANTTEIEPFLPPGTDLNNATVIKVNVTDATPENETDDAYTDITINVGELDEDTCTVFKTGVGFLPEVPDVTMRPTVKPPGEPAFSRDLVNKTVTVRLYVGDPLLGVLPPAEPETILDYYRSWLATGDPNVVETQELLKAADDWSNDVVPPGFTKSITTQELLQLADEWAVS